MGPDSSPRSKPRDVDGIQAELEQLQDKPKDHDEKSVEVNLVVPGEEPRPIFISANLSVEMKQALLNLNYMLRCQGLTLLN